MENRLGLSAQEMIAIFNRMYLETWAATRDRVNWEAANISKQIQEGKEVDISGLLVQLIEVVIESARDGMILTLCENNEEMYEQLRQSGISLPSRAGTEAAVE